MADNPQAFPGSSLLPLEELLDNRARLDGRIRVLKKSLDEMLLARTELNAIITAMLNERQSHEG